ncbi:MAG: hypothetical protein K9L95_02560 [Candidatus Omnitrophica bacterium]|nr:hypothetical protein [Candidatus Omnitrophota bacterium]
MQGADRLKREVQELFPSSNRKLGEKRKDLFRGVIMFYLAESSSKQKRKALGNLHRKGINETIKLGAGLTIGVFSGFRGGNWNNSSSNSRVSDRNNAANVNTNRNNNNGGRAVKTSLNLQTWQCREWENKVTKNENN